MAKAGTTWTWLANGDVRTVTKAMPALVRHRKSGEEMFFNAAIAALQGWVDVRNDPSKCAVQPLTCVAAAPQQATSLRRVPLLALPWHIRPPSDLRGLPIRTCTCTCTYTCTCIWRRTILYGDGSELDATSLAALSDLAEFMASNRVAFKWEAGDVGGRHARPRPPDVPTHHIQPPPCRCLASRRTPSPPIV